MAFTRRELGRLALAGLPAAALFGRSESLFGAILQAKPDSMIDGVQIGAITYCYRSMPDQSAEAILKYVVDSGVSAIELMGGPVESFAGAPQAGEDRRRRHDEAGGHEEAQGERPLEEDGVAAARDRERLPHRLLEELPEDHAHHERRRRDVDLPEDVADQAEGG